MNVCLNIDWLSVRFTGEVVNCYPFEFIEKPYGCKEFRNIYDVKYYGEQLGVLQAGPNLPTLPKEYLIIKFENCWLYDSDLFEIVERLSRQTKWKYKGLSRIDLAGDFNLFQNGQDGQGLIKDFMLAKIEPINKMGVKLHLGNKKRYEFDYMEFGSKTSEIRTYLYNKTKEMEDVKFKPWIDQAHKAAGLDTKLAVWRLEFSLNGTAVRMADKETGEISELTLDSIQDGEFLKHFFQLLISKYFSFVPADGDKNKSRRKRLNLFGTPDYKLVKVKPEVREDVTRATRIFSAKLVKEIMNDKRLAGADRAVVTYWADGWIARRELQHYLDARQVTLSL